MHDPIGEYSSEATTSSPPLHPLHPVASTVDVANWVETAAMPASGYNGSGGVYGGQPPLSRSKGKAAVKKMQPAAQRKWLVFDKRGDTSVMTSYKNEVAQQMGIQLRDLRCVLVAILKRLAKLADKRLLPPSYLIKLIKPVYWKKLPN